ncbi:Moxd1, partial [Symbiodinium pilosum]
KEAVVPSDCTNSWNVDEINVLGVVYHAHLVGKSLNIDVVRANEYVGAMRLEHLYDFNHQSLEPPSVKKVRRGDDLILRCAYDTSGKTTPTPFGDFTQTEMCWSAFLYYPAQRMTQAIIQGSAGDRRATFCAGYGVSSSYVPRPAQPACEWKGFLHSTEAYQVLSDMGVD